MLKIRLMGTKADMEWFKGVIRRNHETKILEISDVFYNRGTNQYYRMYMEVEPVKEVERDV